MLWVQSLLASFREVSAWPSRRLLRLGVTVIAVLAAVPLAIPAYAAAGSITEFPLPAANAFPGSITTGPDGNLWFAESGSIGRISSRGSLAEFALPAGHTAKSIAPGPDGKLWFTEPAAGRVGNITVAGAVSEFLLPGNTGYGTPINRPQQIVAGPDGKLWFTQTVFSRSSVRTVDGKIDSMTVAGVLTNQFPLPNGGTRSTTPVPDAITVGADGNLWFTDTQQGLIGRITTAGVLTSFKVPHGSPAGIASGPDGNLWLTASFSGTGGSRLDRLTTAGSFTESSVPADGGNGATLGAIARGADGNLWFTHYDMTTSKGSIFRATTAFALSRFSFSTSTEIDGLTAGPDAAVWFTKTDSSTGQSAIGRLATA